MTNKQNVKNMVEQNVVAVFMEYDSGYVNLVGLAHPGQEEVVRDAAWTENKFLITNDTQDEACGGFNRKAVLETRGAFTLPDNPEACEMDALYESLDACGQWHLTFPDNPGEVYVGQDIPTEELEEEEKERDAAMQLSDNQLAGYIPPVHEEAHEDMGHMFDYQPPVDDVPAVVKEEAYAQDDAITKGGEAEQPTVNRQTDTLEEGAKLTDTQLNKLLGNVDTMPTLIYPDPEEELHVPGDEVLEEDDDEDADIWRPRVTESIYKSKGSVKGAMLEGSFYTAISALMERVADSHTKKPINELENGLFDEALKLIESGKQKGVTFNLPGFKVARERIAGRQGEFNPECPVEVLIKYRQDIYAASEAIEEFRKDLFAEFERNGGPVLLDKGKVSTDWLLKKTGAKKQVVDESAKLEAYKESVTSRYAAHAERFGNGEQTFAPAVLVAELYVANIREQTANRKERRKRVVNAMIDAFIAEHGYEPNADVMAAIKVKADNAMAEYSDNGFSSIQGLFPLGFIQFLQWIATGEVKTIRRKQEYVNVFMQSEQPLSALEQAQWRCMEGEPIIFTDGVAKGLTVSEEDQVDIDERFVSPKLKDLANVEPAVVDELMNNQFKRGAKLWVGGQQVGIVLHVKVYKTGVSLFIKNFKSV